MIFPAPSLLDRLLDLDPQTKSESSAGGNISPRRMRDILKRDITWLLTTIRIEDVEELTTLAHTKSSVLNYGIRDLSGVPEQNIDAVKIQNTIKQALVNFEPRLDPTSIVVSLIPYEQGETRGVAKLQISGQWTNNLYQDQVVIEARVNFDTGSVDLVDGER